MKEVLKFRFEYFTTVLFITVTLLSYQYVGFDSMIGIMFNFIATLEIPVCYFGTRYARRLLYNTWYGDSDED